ncbi:ABC transporter ATP-binding protein [Actinomadura vinacea]
MNKTASRTGEGALSLGEVTVRFESDRGLVTALQDVSVELPEHGFTSLLGPSGCGKSTLLRVVADLLEPAAGAVSVFGATPREVRRRREIGFVFQDAALLPWQSVIDNVRLPLRVGKSAGRGPAESPEEMLELVGLKGRERAYPHELSGGMRQRVAIARALVCRPRVLLMDEPFGALDEITRDRLNEELLNIWAATGTTVLFVTHSIPEAVFLSQRVLVLSSHPGRVRELVEIDLPYPRDLELRDRPEFTALTSRLRRLLETC